MNPAHLIARCRTADIGQLLSGLAAFGGAEVATRLIRIASVVVIARQVSPTIMGVAALALSLFEVVRVLANAGIGQRIIAESPEQLAATCNTAHRLFWVWCLGVSLIQLTLAAVLHAFGMGEIAAMLAVLSGVYLFMPAGLVQVFLLMRDGRFGIIARITAAQAIADQLLTLAFVLLWPSAWAIVLPKLVTAPLWLLLVRRAKAWRPQAAAGLTPWRSFLGFAAGVLVSELVNVGRTQLDKLLVGALFGVQALGIYYFAFNAGLGITTSFITALGQVLFPYISAAQAASSRARRCRQGLWLGLGLFLPVLALQVGLAPWYVPLVFGEQWREAAPLVSVLALGAVPMIFAAVASAWLRAQRRPGVEALLNSVAAAAALGGLTLFAGLGLMASAWAYVIGLALALIPASIHLLSGREGIATLAVFQRASA